MREVIKAVKRKDDYKELFEEKKADHAEIMNVRALERGSLEKSFQSSELNLGNALAETEMKEVVKQ